MQTLLQKEGISQKVQVTNVPGAGGTIGLAQFVNQAKGDPESLIVGGYVMVGAILTNNSPVDLTMVTPIARLTGEAEAIVAPASSDIETIADLVARLKADPGAVSWGGGSAGGVDHITAGLIAKAAGVDPAYIKTMRGIFPGVDIDELVGASALHIEPKFARDMKSHFPDIGIDDVIALRAMGIDCDFVTDMQKAGVKMRSADDAIELRATSGFRPVVKPRPAAAPRPVAKAVRGDNVAVVDMERGVIEARRSDGRTARIEFPQTPEPPRPPVRD